MRKAKRIAIVGATGMVGNAFMSLLKEDFFPNAEVDLLASKKSKGILLNFRDQELVVQDLAEYDFSNTDLALFSQKRVDEPEPNSKIFLSFKFMVLRNSIHG